MSVDDSEYLDDFEKDLNELMERMSVDTNAVIVDRLRAVKNQLISSHREIPLKINHSAMQLVAAKHLIGKGYKVTLEHRLKGGRLSCDVYGEKKRSRLGLGKAIVEAEAAFVPPPHALNPITYLGSRIASKIARYSGFADKFILGIPPYYIAQIPQTFLKPPRVRTDEEIATIKKLCDSHYTNPEVNLDDIRNARLHTIYIIDVDKGEVREFGPQEYIEKYPLIEFTQPALSPNPPVQ